MKFKRPAKLPAFWLNLFKLPLSLQINLRFFLDAQRANAALKEIF